MIDLLVVGGGPVGLVSAIHAAQSGLDVSVIEPRVGSIDKACGEGLMPGALAHLSRIGVDPKGANFFGIRYISGDRSAEARFSGNPGRGVRRIVLHDSLTQRARELGVNFIEGRVEAVNQQTDFIEAGGIRARFLIGADGLHSVVRHQLGLEIGRKKAERQRFGIRQHFAVKPWSDCVEVYWLPNAEVYVTPVDDGTVGVAILGSDKMHFEEIISRIPKLNDQISYVDSTSKLRGAGPLRQRVRARSVGRALLVGDASGYVDALTGEGLQVGFAEAEAAVRAVVHNDLKSYEAQWRKVTRSYRLLAGGLLWAASNRGIRPVIVPSAQAVPPVFRLLVNTLS